MYKKAALILLAIGVLITSAGSALMSQRLVFVGQPLRIGGMMLTLVALTTYLLLSVAQRHAPAHTRYHDRSLQTSFPLVINTARVTAIVLISLSALSLAAAVFQMYGSLLRQGWYAVYMLANILVMFATGVALWLLADIAQRGNRQATFDDDRHMTHHDKPDP